MEVLQPLHHQTLSDVPVQAFQHPLLSFLGGPVLLDPDHAQLRHKRYDRACDSFAADACCEQCLDGHWIYVGPKYHHFGHVMAEMVHRILPAKTLFPNIQNYLAITTPDGDDEPGFAVRGFGDAELFTTLRNLTFDCAIRFKRDIWVMAASGGDPSGGRLGWSRQACRQTFLRRHSATRARSRLSFASVPDAGRSPAV